MAQAAGVSPSQYGAQDAQPRTKGSVMATTLVGAHAFEHLYAHSIPIIILAIITEFELGRIECGGCSCHSFHIRRHHQHQPGGSWWTCSTTG